MPVSTVAFFGILIINSGSMIENFSQSTTSPLQGFSSVSGLVITKNLATAAIVSTVVSAVIICSASLYYLPHDFYYLNT